MVPSRLPEMTYTADEQCQILFWAGPGFLLSRDAGKSCVQVQLLLSVYSSIYLQKYWLEEGEMTLELVAPKNLSIRKTDFLEKVSSFSPGLFESGRNWCQYWIKVRKEWSQEFPLKMTLKSRKPLLYDSSLLFILNVSLTGRYLGKVIKTICRPVITEDGLFNALLII